MISVDRHGITNRTYEEDDEEECNVASINDQANNSLKLSIYDMDSFDYTSINGFIFCTDFAALPCAHSIIGSLEMIDIGIILNSSTSNTKNKKDLEYGKLYYSKQHQVMLVIIENEVPDYLAMTLVLLFDAFIMSYVIILNRINMKSNHTIIPNDIINIQTSSSSILYHMMTTTFDTAMLTKYSFNINQFFNSNIKNKQSILNLPVGVILKGIAVALFNYVYIREIPGIMFITITTEIFLNITTMKAFEMISPLLSAISNDNYNNNLNKNNKYYQKILKLDPYVIKTENLYC